MTDTPFDLPALVERAEETLLGGTREYDRAEVAAATGLPLDDAQALWRALGFATVDDGEKAFTDGDIKALKQVRQLTESMGLDDDVIRAMTRMLGRTFSRLASWQGQLVIEQIGRSPDLVSSPADVAQFLDQSLLAMQDLQNYVWRRQLAAYLSRVTSTLGSPDTATMAVGFADMAQFTALTRRSSEAELREVLETFETVATDVIAANKGQIVKTIGDEVLFVADDAVAGAEIALGLLEASADSEVVPPLRVGIAKGPVVSRLGDVFGATVNIASRLTSLARTDSVLIDEGMHEALADDDRYAQSSLRPASVRGYNHLRSWRLRRAQ